jgi:hypothetical protein
MEVYHSRLILYGCGDFINDYEGIRGYEEYRDDLALMYFADIEPTTGILLRSRSSRFKSGTSGLTALRHRTSNGCNGRCSGNVSGLGRVSGSIQAAGLSFPIDSGQGAPPISALKEFCRCVEASLAKHGSEPSTGVDLLTP